MTVSILAYSSLQLLVYVYPPPRCVGEDASLSCVVVLKLGGLGAVGVGTWRLTDDEKVITDAVDFVLDPFIILCIIGAITFIIAFLGCVGAIREHSLMLKSVSYGIFYTKLHDKLEFYLTIKIDSCAFVTKFSVFCASLQYDKNEQD